MPETTPDSDTDLPEGDGVIDKILTPDGSDENGTNDSAELSAGETRPADAEGNENDDAESDAETNEGSSKLPPSVQQEIDDLLLKFKDIQEGAFFSDTQKRDVIRLLACLREYKHLLEGELKNIRAKGTIISYAEKLKIDPLSDQERLALERLKALVRPKTKRVLAKDQKPIFTAIIRLLRKGNRDEELEAFLQSNNIINTNRWNLERTRMGILTAELVPDAFLPPVEESSAIVSKSDDEGGVQVNALTAGQSDTSDHSHVSAVEQRQNTSDVGASAARTEFVQAAHTFSSGAEHIETESSDNLSSLVAQNRTMVNALLDTNLPPATAEAFRQQLAANNALMSALVIPRPTERVLQSGSSPDQSSSDASAVVYQAANGGRVRIDSTVQGFVVVLDGNNAAKADL
jgi:hypothetical protein